jgi:L-iditol 2-dehydrogenase
MKALVLTAPNEFSIREVETPTPGPKEVLCRVKAITICGTDAHLIAGDYPGFWPPTYPFIPGHEWAGEIAELGPGAASLGFAIGDRVAGTSHDACGFCKKCVEGRYNLCENYGNTEVHRQYGHNWQGAFAEYVVHGVKSVFRLPDKLTFHEGALLDPAAIALHTAERGNIKSGDTVVVLGPGPVGLLTCDAARTLGAGRVIVIGRGGRLQKAAELGYEIVDYTTSDPVETLKAMTEGIGPDVALDCAGVPDTYRWALAMLHKGGRCASVGIPVEDVTLSLQDLVLYEKELVGVRATAGGMRRVMPLVADGRIRVNALHTHTFPLEEFATALDTFNRRRDGALKVIIEP